MGVRAGATLAPGASIGTLTTQNVSLAVGATLAVEIDVDATPDADLLDVFGTIDLGGATLDLTRLNTPPLIVSPATFMIARNDSTDPITGTFAAMTGLPPNWSAAIDYAYAGTDILGRVGTGNDLAVTLTLPDPAVYLAADFNEDGFVDGDDLAVWQAEFGRATGATLAHGDANEDGAVDGDRLPHLAAAARDVPQVRRHWRPPSRSRTNVLGTGDRSPGRENRASTSLKEDRPDSLFWYRPPFPNAACHALVGVGMLWQSGAIVLPSISSA